MLEDRGNYQQIGSDIHLSQTSQPKDYLQGPDKSRDKVSRWVRGSNFFKDVNDFAFKSLRIMISDQENVPHYE